MIYYYEILIGESVMIANKNKPFYKKSWFIFLIVIIAIVIVGCIVGCAYHAGRSDSTAQERTEQSSGKKSDTNNTDLVSDDRGDQISKENATILRAYNKIKLGDLAKSGQGGSSYKKIKKILGSSPSDTSSSETSGIKTELDSWDFDGIAIIVTFVNHHAVGSSLTGLRWKRAKPTFNKSNFKKVSTNLSSDDVLKKFGIPDEITQLLIFGKYQTKYTWFTGITGSLGANVSIDFVNTNVSGKSQTGLEK